VNHSEIEAALRRLATGQLDLVRSKLVHRQDARHWSVAGGPAVTLLVAIDQLMAGRRATRTAVPA
jgi:hypothetical protein